MLGIFKIRWRDISISKKLYFVVGVMAFLIAGELLALRFAMRTLSAARAFVHGEGLWSKSQKDAIIALQRYAATKDESDFTAFEEYLKVPEGDHLARVELEKANPNIDVIRSGFLQGRIHPDDIDPMLDLLRRFSKVSYIAHAIDYWREADWLLDELKETALAYRQAAYSENRALLNNLIPRIRAVNERLTVAEDGFSSSLGEGSRWLERVVLSLLFLAVLSVETVGLTLAFLTSRSISVGLRQLNQSADRIGQGEFGTPVPVHSKDEIGLLADALNRMRVLLQEDYLTLEKRVAERTHELEKLAQENARLYDETKKALEYRDEFLSVASHELKTPVTAIHLQLQIFERLLKDLPEDEFVNKSKKIVTTAVSRTRLLKSLLEELLDLTRLRLGKLEVRPDDCDLAAVVREAVSQLTPETSEKKNTIRIDTPNTLPVRADPVRISQVVTNLVSNALKYGDGKPIQVVLARSGDGATLSVRDHGMGIDESKTAQIFERFERAVDDPNITGLGLGLYISRHIVEAHSGSIEVHSSLGQGSTFVVTLPSLT